MSILAKYLKKLGVDDFSELSQEEKKTYREWEDALSGKKLTDDDISIFLQQEEDESIQKLTTKKLKTREDTFLKMKLDFVRRVRGYLKLPEAQKSAVENQIKSLID